MTHLSKLRRDAPDLLLLEHSGVGNVGLQVVHDRKASEQQRWENAQLETTRPYAHMHHRLRHSIGGR